MLFRSYGALAGLDVLLENYTTVWTMWAHMLPELQARERARLQDFARFGRSFQLGLRKRDGSDQRVTAAVSLLAPTFDQMGKLNLKKINDRKADLTDETAALWDEVNELLTRIETSVA